MNESEMPLHAQSGGAAKDSRRGYSLTGAATELAEATRATKEGSGAGWLAKLPEGLAEIAKDG